MRAVFIAISFAATLSLVSCASDGPTADELQEQLHRGATGQGRITPDIDRRDDPYVKPREGAPGAHS